MQETDFVTDQLKYLHDQMIRCRQAFQPENWFKGK